MKNKTTIIILVVLAVLFAWIELSVGLFSTPWAGS